MKNHIKAGENKVEAQIFGLLEIGRIFNAIDQFKANLPILKEDVNLLD